MSQIINRHLSRQLKTSAGFTLLELMVAISIFAVVAMLAMGGMSYVMHIQKQSQSSLDDLNRMQIFFEVFSRELRHIVNRPVRGEYGLKLSALSSETSDGVDGIEFTHQGRFVPLQNASSQLSLQRVAYFIEGNKLIKKTWPVLDRVEDTQSYQHVLLDNIKYFNISYLIEISKQQFEWQESLSDSDQLRGIRIEISQHENDVYRIFSVRI